jgi:RNA recognition motif-containing protein
VPQVIDASIVLDPWTRESRGFGFVTMATLKEAERCIKYLDSSVLEGRVITVEKVLSQDCYSLIFFNFPSIWGGFCTYTLAFAAEYLSALLVSRFC